MNYLAHAFLSGNNPQLLVGNFIADHLRGNDFSAYPPGVVEGIKLHRRIDTFTDAHPEFKTAKRLFYRGFEKHSGILVDIYFDHLLASRFGEYSQTTLTDFSRHVYSVYMGHHNLLPNGSQRFLEYVVKNNIYHSYASLAGIEKVLFHLSQRIKHGVQLHDSVPVFNAQLPQIQTAFEAFFNDARLEFGLTEKP